MPISIRRLVLEDHLTAFEHSSFRYKNDRILAGVSVAVFAQQAGQFFDIKLVLRDNTAIGGAGHGRQHGGKTGVTSENLYDQESFVRTGRRSQRVGHRDGSAHARTKTNAVIGPRHVVIHGFGDGHNFDTLFK